MKSSYTLTFKKTKYFTGISLQIRIMKETKYKVKTSKKYHNYCSYTGQITNYIKWKEDDNTCIILSVIQCDGYSWKNQEVINIIVIYHFVNKSGTLFPSFKQKIIFYGYMWITPFMEEKVYFIQLFILNSFKFFLEIWLI